jgi:peptidoglycan/LPS O-acetylase OafA/YrhL
MTTLVSQPRLARLDSLTGLRFVAAFAVLLRHTVTDLFPLPGLFEFSFIGPIGVGFFFVLSGFLLTWRWKPGGRKRDFYVRRGARIVPLHILTTIVASAFLILAGTPFWVSTLVSLFLLQSWLTDPYRLGGNGVSWSLSVEAFFYAIFPFMIQPISRSSVRKCAIIVGGAVAMLIAWILVYSVLLKTGFPAVSAFSAYTNPVYRLGEFVIGSAVAVAMRKGWRPRWSLTTSSWVALGLYVAIAGVNALVIRSGLHLGDGSGLPLSVLDLMFLPATVLLVSSAAASDLSGRESIFGGKWFVRLGEWSFALYLVQMIVISQLTAFVSHGSVTWVGGVLAVVAMIGCIGLSAALFYCVERPAERAIKRKFVAVPQGRNSRDGDDNLPVAPMPAGKLGS